jgi:cytoskeletal protein CcmA (bactofilin family)
VIARSRRRVKLSKISTVIGRDTEIRGDVTFQGGLHVEGAIRGNVMAPDEVSNVLTVSEAGVIEGDVRVPNVVLNGAVIGDVHVSERIELAAKARISGSVYYRLIEMAMGAEVNGSLVHRPDGGESATAPQTKLLEKPQGDDRAAMCDDGDAELIEFAEQAGKGEQS